MKNEQSNDDDKRDSYPQLNRTGTGRSNNDGSVFGRFVCCLRLHTRPEHIPPPQKKQFKETTA